MHIVILMSKLYLTIIQYNNEHLTDQHSKKMCSHVERLVKRF